MVEVNNDDLRREIRVILKDADLNSLSSKKVRQMLENLFQCDFNERKKEIDDILMDEITNRDQTSQSNDDQNDQSSDDEKSSSHVSSSTSARKSKSSRRSTTNARSVNQSDEELARIIHQEENRPSLRHSRPLKLSVTNSSSSKKSAKKTSEKRKTSYNKDLQLSDQLADVVGGSQMPRSEVVKRMWNYFKEHQLLDPQNKQFVNCDETLTKLFGRKRIRAFGMLKDLSRHMTDPDKQ